jgi:hypothetical protein
MKLTLSTQLPRMDPTLEDIHGLTLVRCKQLLTRPNRGHSQLLHLQLEF